jgi:hypothetical protein
MQPLQRYTNVLSGQHPEQLQLVAAEKPNVGVYPGLLALQILRLNQVFVK